MPSLSRRGSMVWTLGAACVLSSCTIDEGRLRPDSGAADSQASDTALDGTLDGTLDGAHDTTGDGVPEAAADASDTADVADTAMGPDSGATVAIPAGTLSAGEVTYSVAVGAFELDRTEVTVRAYGLCVAAGRCATAELTGCSYATWGAGADDMPINCVSWNEAVAFCAWAGKRLPTEWEWEYAARYDDGRTYPWGAGAPSGTNACWNRTSGPCPTASSSPEGDSKLGLEDLAGNVCEWTASWFCASPPCTSGSERAYRGGNWDLTDPTNLRSTQRLGISPDLRTWSLGFRCAR